MSDSNSAPAPPTWVLTLALELPQDASVQVFVKSLDWLLVEVIEASAEPATVLVLDPRFAQIEIPAHVFVPESDCDATEDTVDSSVCYSNIGVFAYINTDNWTATRIALRL